MQAARLAETEPERQLLEGDLRLPQVLLRQPPARLVQQLLERAPRPPAGAAGCAGTAPAPGGLLQLGRAPAQMLLDEPLHLHAHRVAAQGLQPLGARCARSSAGETRRSGAVQPLGLQQQGHGGLIEAQRRVGQQAPVGA